MRDFFSKLFAGQMAGEIEEHRVVEANILRLNAELEARVASRTAELVKSESISRQLAEEQRLATASLQHALEGLKREMKRRQDLENQLVQSQKMEAIGRLAGGVAHDFNNLLTVILGYNEMLLDHVAGDAVAHDFAVEILQAAERASSLTNQLLAFSRRQLLVPRVLDLNEVVRQIDKMLRRIIGEDIELQTQLFAELSPVKADPSHIDQVIMNLAVNSRDAMPNGGRLTIETTNMKLTGEDAGTYPGFAPGPYVTLSVSDTGTGMDAITKSRLFEPFFTTKEKGKGTGLGLSIVYGIVKQNGGEILVESEPGQGTTFKIYLPVAIEAVEEARAGGSEIESLSGAGTILLVEDEHQVRKLTRTMLARQGYRIFDACSGADALVLAYDLSGSVDLLVTDIVMPQMGGFELAAAMQAAHPSIKVLFMSGYTDNGIVGEGTLTPETPFIQKPFTAAALHRKVREVLAG